MRILHTADWHVGKKLGRIDRSSEFEAALDEIVSIARDQKVDLVVVAGDLLDRAAAPLESIQLVVDALIRLADVCGSVVAMPGNHDSPALFELLGPLLENKGIHLTPRIARPDAGGVIRISSRDGTESASVGMFPFLHEAQVVDFMSSSEEWFKGYAHRIRLISAALCEAFDPESIGILVGHWFIEGAEVGGGERKIHIGQQYAATSQSIPPGASYVALGHIHRPQAIRAGAPARYAGSLLQLDFSERGHNKEVVIVDAKPGIPAKVRSIQLRSGRKLIRVEDSLESLRTRVDEFGDGYLDVRVRTSGPVFGLSEQVREFLPAAVLVQAVYERQESDAARFSSDPDRSLTDLYGDYYSIEHGAGAPAEVLDAMRGLEEEVLSAST